MKGLHWLLVSLVVLTLGLVGLPRTSVAAESWSGDSSLMGDPDGGNGFGGGVGHGDLHDYRVRSIAPHPRGRMPLLAPARRVYESWASTWIVWATRRK